MLGQPVELRYQGNAITGGYSFSALNNTIILPEYVEQLENPKIREAIQYEAEKARHYYIAEVNRLKTIGESKVNTFLTKREAVKKAKTEAQMMYGDVWQEIETILKTNKISKLSKSQSETLINIGDDDISKGVKFLVTVKGVDDIAQLVLCESAELTIKVVQSH